MSTPPSGPPGYPPPPYGGAQPYPGYGYPPPVAATNTMAILSLVMSFVFSPLGIVFGHIARKQMRQTGEQGHGLATAGLIIGYIFTALMVLGCAVTLIAIVLVGHAAATSG